MKKEELVRLYYKNNARKLHKMVDRVINNLHFKDIEISDFYSLANEIFVDVLRRYDSSKDFDGFLYSCLMNKFKTEMTKRNRIKRKAQHNAISLDAPVGEEGGMTVGEMLAHKSTTETDFFEEREDTYSDKMNRYLNKLSSLQKEVLRLISIGFMPSEILEELHINKKMYEDCYQAIHSYRNISVLI